MWAAAWLVRSGLHRVPPQHVGSPSAGWAIYRPPLSYPPPPPSCLYCPLEQIHKHPSCTIHSQWVRIQLYYWKKKFPLFKMRCYLTHGYEHSRWEAKCAVHTYTFCLRGCRLMTKTHRQTWINEWRMRQYMCVRSVIGFILKAQLPKITKKSPYQDSSNS